MADGAGLAEAIAALPNLGSRTTLTLTGTQLTVRLTREMWGVEADTVDVARAVSRA